MYRVHTRTEDNLPTYIKGRAKFSKYGYLPAQSYTITDDGIDRDCKFINRRWYWLEYDGGGISKNRGCFFVDPAADCILSPKSYGLGTEEEHFSYRETQQESEKGDSEGQRTPSAQSNSSKGKALPSAVESPIEQFAKALGDYIATKETQQVVTQIEELSLATTSTMATATIARAGGSGTVQVQQPQQALQQPAQPPAGGGGGAPAGGGGAPGGGAPGGRGGAPGGGGGAPGGGGVPPQQPAQAQAQPQAINGALKGAMPPPFNGTRGTVDLFLQTFNFYRNANYE